MTIDEGGRLLLGENSENSDNDGQRTRQAFVQRALSAARTTGELNGRDEWSEWSKTNDD